MQVTEERAELVFLSVAAAVALGSGIWATMGSTKALEYLAGYLLEQSLSIDNLFVFVLVFDYFKTDALCQEKASCWCSPIVPSQLIVFLTWEQRACMAAHALMAVHLLSRSQI